MKTMDKIIEQIKNYPTIMHITQEIKVMHSLEELSKDEIIDEKDAFIKILRDLILSHGDNYVLEHDIKTIKEYKYFISWLNEIKTIDEEFIEDAMAEMEIYYPTQDRSIEKIFTEEELEYLCISGIFQRKYNGTEYYIIIYLDDKGVIGIDKNKMVYRIENNDPKLINNNLMDYLKLNKK